MKLTWLSLAFLGVCLQAEAQAPTEQIQTMKACSFLTGKWTGEGWIAFGPGQKRTFQETESVEPKLNGLVLQVEGLGRNAAGETVHAALATLSFDGNSKQYHFRAYDNAGHFLDASADCKDGTMTWSMAAGPRQMHYTIRLNEKGQWYETGEMTSDGQTAGQPFFEMTLTKSN